MTSFVWILIPLFVLSYSLAWQSAVGHWARVVADETLSNEDARRKLAPGRYWFWTLAEAISLGLIIGLLAARFVTAESVWMETLITLAILLVGYVVSWALMPQPGSRYFAEPILRHVIRQKDKYYREEKFEAAAQYAAIEEILQRNLATTHELTEKNPWPRT